MQTILNGNVREFCLEPKGNLGPMARFALTTHGYPWANGEVCTQNPVPSLGQWWALHSKPRAILQQMASFARKTQGHRLADGEIRIQTQGHPSLANGEFCTKDPGASLGRWWDSHSNPWTSVGQWRVLHQKFRATLGPMVSFALKTQGQGRDNREVCTANPGPSLGPAGPFQFYPRSMPSIFLKSDVRPVSTPVVISDVFVSESFLQRLLVVKLGTYSRPSLPASHSRSEW